MLQTSAAIEQLLSDEKAILGLCLSWKDQDLARLTSRVVPTVADGSQLRSFQVSLSRVSTPSYILVDPLWSFQVSLSRVSTASLSRLTRVLGGVGENSFMSDYISPVKAHVAKTELLLETYLHSFDSMFQKLQARGISKRKILWHPFSVNFLYSSIFDNSINNLVWTDKKSDRFMLISRLLDY